MSDQAAQQRNIRIVKLLGQAISENRLVPSYRPLLEVRTPSRLNFMFGCELEIEKDQLVRYTSLERLGRGTGVNSELDRWMIQHGLEALKNLHGRQPEARLVIPQSLDSLANPEYPRWLERQKSLLNASTQGLVIAFRLSQITHDLVQAHRCFAALRELDIETMIEGFSEHPTALKVLRAMNADHVAASRSLQLADDGVVEHRLKEFRQLGTGILLPEIHAPTDVNPAWSCGAHLLGGDYIHPVRHDTDFVFPATIV